MMAGKQRGNILSCENRVKNLYSRLVKFKVENALESTKSGCKLKRTV